MGHSAADNQKLVNLSVVYPLSFKLILSALSSLFITGCSTVKVHNYNDNILHPYLGTKTAVSGFSKSFSDYVMYNQVTLMAIDIPFCFVANTLLLSYDAVAWFTRQNE